MPEDCEYERRVDVYEERGDLIYAVEDKGITPCCDAIGR